MIMKLLTRRVPKACLAAALTIPILGCGGEEASSGSSANRAPQFTSSAIASVAENSKGVFYTAATRDADGDTVTYSIAGGADAAFFQLNGAGLAFVSSPNFDRFADADQNNTYEVTLRATDGRAGTADQSVQVTVGNDREGIAVQRFVTGFKDPVGLSSFIGSAFILVGERDGTIWSINTDDGSRRVQFDLGLAPGRELLDVAAADGRQPAAIIRDSSGIYLVPSLTGLPRNEIKLADGDPLGAGAAIAFNRSSELGGPSQLIIAIGDPGGQRAQTDSGYGKVFIISDPSFLSTLSQFLLIGRGIRQPSRIFALPQGALIADVGETREHELSRLNSRRAVNLGWPFMEGSAALMSGAPSPLIAPMFTYEVGSGPKKGVGIRGGAYLPGPSQAEPNRIASLANCILFGDANGSMFTVASDFNRSSFENRTRDFVPDTGSVDRVVAIADLFDRGLFILDADGDVFKVSAAS